MSLVGFCSRIITRCFAIGTVAVVIANGAGSAAGASPVRKIGGLSGGGGAAAAVAKPPQSATAADAGRQDAGDPVATLAKTALRLDGVAQYASISDAGNNLSFPAGASITLESWIWVAGWNTADQIQIVVGKGMTGGSADANYQMSATNGYLDFFYANDAGQPIEYVSTGAVIPLQTWTHIAVTYVFSDGATPTLFVNSSPVAGQFVQIADRRAPTAVSTAASIGADNPDYLGRWGEFLNGRVDEIRVWETAMTQSQVATVMNLHLSGAEAGLRALWRCDDAGGSSISDSSASGNTGTLVGSPTWIVSGALIDTILVRRYIPEVVELGGVDLSHGTYQSVVTALPAKGSLYQYNNGSRGAKIVAVGTAVSDSQHRVVFDPGEDEPATLYDQFNYKVTDSGAESPSTTVKVNLYEPTPVIPSTPASQIVVGVPGATSVDATWTNGTGARRLVLASRGHTVDSDPVNGKEYTANPVFGLGSEIGTGNFVVYEGRQSGCTMSFASKDTYYFRVYEFNGTGTSRTLYNTSAATGNPNWRYLPVALSGFAID